MKKMIVAAAAAMTMVVMTGCGGTSGSSSASSYVDPIELKDGIIIIRHYNPEICMGDVVWNIATSGGDRDPIIRVEPNSISCASYGRSNNGGNAVSGEICLEDDLVNEGGSYYYKYDTACVVGMNDNYSKAQASTDIQLPDREKAMQSIKGNIIDTILIEK